MDTKTIIERVNTMEDIFSIGGKSLEQIISPNDTNDEAAYKVLKFGIAVLNEGVAVDHSNVNQRKYEPRMYYSGSVLSYDGYVTWPAGSSCGPRLCYLSYETMIHGIKIMEEYYNNYFN